MNKDLPGVERDVTREGRDLSRYLYRPIVLQEPDRLVSPASWLEHVPFAFWMVDALRPVSFVELGTHSGNSYSAFAQAVSTLGLPTACYAVDTWKGDPHSGSYSEDVFSEWRDYHDRHFSSFSTLIRTTFSDAVHRFADGSIDLLHLDGYHTLHAIQQDIPLWLPKMSDRGVLLLHDINVREGDFGAWQFWRQIENTYPSFAFLHGHGLGILGVGRDVPEAVQWLLSRARVSPDELSEIRLYFSRLGRRLSLQHECGRYEKETQKLRSRLLARGVAMPAFEADQSAQRVRSGHELLALESVLKNACEERDQTIRELDAEARALASQLEAARTQLQDNRSAFQRGAASVWSRLRAVRHSRIGHAAGVLRTIPSIVAMTMGRGWRAALPAVRQFAYHPRRLQEASVAARSGLFDEEHYLAESPDLRSANVHPLIHYVLWGVTEGRRPNLLFDPLYYLGQYPDVARAGYEPLSHFALRGGAEQRNPGPHFESKYYLAMNPDVRKSGENPLRHFLKQGWQEGRSPSPSFDFAGYVARYEDVRSSGLDPLAHYLNIGLGEGRDARPLTEASLPALPRVRVASRSISIRPRDRSPEPLVLCLTHVCPWPPYAGNSYRIFRMLQWLRKSGFRVLPVIVPLEGETPDAESIRRVEELFSNVVVVDRGGQVRYALSGLPDVLASLNGEHTPRYSTLLGEEARITPRERELLTIDRTYCPDAAIAAVLRLHSVLGPYVFLAEYVWMTRVLPLIDGRAVKVIDTHDVFSTKADKVLRFGIQDLWLSEQEEAKRLVLADLVVAIQEDEHRLLQQLVPERPVLTAGIDCDVVGVPQLPEARRILYVASGNPMNARGLRDFLRFAWPTILEQVPDAQLLVAGAVSRTLKEKLPGVTSLGMVEDLDELYKSVRVVINPALAGTGGKIKTVEALGHLRPIVTFPTGVEGLPGELKKLCDVVQDWYEFGPRVILRLSDECTSAFSPLECERIRRATSAQMVYADLSAHFLDLLRQRHWAASRNMPAART
ncbi:MAG: class I SAM-dependent methyltransferase [Vicinamibacterales bacterium]|nr:class I SAM-dependent methyltransferase [Vicinamibacterales bacterium]